MAGMMLKLAVGDAYGAGFEYVSDEMVRRENTLVRYAQNTAFRALRPGCYTDDTQMSIAVAEAILSDEPWTKALLAKHFVQAFKRDERKGYAQGLYHFLLKTPDGEQFLANIEPWSDKSGGAMRAGPVGLYPTIEQVMERCRLQASLTHDTPGGIAAAQGAALAVHYFRYRRGPQRDLGKFLAKYVPGDWTTPWQGPVGHKGMMSARAAITALERSRSLRELLEQSIAYTGDVDTVATIALAAGAWCDEIAQDLPTALYDGLENGRYGRTYLEELDRKLEQKF